MQRASVDLPQPDSPTTPSVSPSRLSVKLTPSTAFTAATCFWKMIPRVTGKHASAQVLDDEQVAVVAGLPFEGVATEIAMPQPFARPSSRPRPSCAGEELPRSSRSFVSWSRWQAVK